MNGCTASKESASSNPYPLLLEKSFEVIIEIADGSLNDVVVLRVEDISIPLRMNVVSFSCAVRMENSTVKKNIKKDFFIYTFK